jgi:hypothetical protein
MRKKATMGRGALFAALFAMMGPALALAEATLPVGTRLRVMTVRPRDGSIYANPDRVVHEDSNSITLDDTSGIGTITWTKENRWLIAKVEAGNDQVLTLWVSGGTGRTTVRREDIISTAVSEWRRTRGRSALIGAAIGAGAGALVGFGLGDDPPESFPIVLSAGYKALILGALLMPVGALFGATVPPAERWGEVPADRIRVGLAPLRGGGAAVSLGLAY